MTFKKYAEALVASKEDAEKSLAPARAKQQEAALGIKVAELDLEVQTAEGDLAELVTSFPLDLDAIVDAQDAIDLQKRRLNQLKTLGTELF